MNNKEGKEELWKRGKKGMNNEEGKEEPWKRWKKGINFHGSSLSSLYGSSLSSMISSPCRPGLAPGT